jgi:hypothetical protein
MKKILFILAFIALASNAHALFGTMNYVTLTATDIGAPNTYTASALTTLAGSTLDCNHVTIQAADSSTTINLAFCIGNTTTVQYWPIKPGQVFDIDLRTNSVYGIKANTTITTMPAVSVKYLSTK